MSLYHSDSIRMVVVDSSQRFSGNSSQFTIALSLPTEVSDFDRVVLNQISIPRSWYDIDSNLNTFFLVENFSLPKVVTLTPGLYNVNSLILSLQTALNLASPNGYTYTISYPNSSTQVNTNKFTFKCSNTSVTKSFIFTNALYLQLGFNANTTNDFTGTITSTNSISISYINRLFLKSSICDTAQDNILQEILVAGQYPSCSYVYYENPLFDAQSRVFTSSTNNSWTFSLYDRYGNLVNLQGQDYVFSLFLYKKDRTSELHHESLKISNLEKLL